MRLFDTSAGVAGFVWLLSGTLLGQSWTLPQGVAVKDAGPRTYRVVMDHTTSNTTGQVVQRQRVTADYTRGLPGGHAVWRNVTVAESNGPAEIAGSGQKREFMEGFRYRTGSGSLAETMQPEFFKAFPPTAVFERNLVWDTGMIEMFGQDQFEHLKLNAPYQVISGQDVDMPGVGTFHNRDVQLTWIGTIATERTGLRRDRLPRVLQPGGDRERGHDVEGPEPLLGRDLGVAGNQADRVRHARGRRFGRVEAGRSGGEGHQRVSQRRLRARGPEVEVAVRGSMVAQAGRLWMVLGTNVVMTIMVPLIGLGGSRSSDMNDLMRVWATTLVYTNVTGIPAIVAGPSLVERLLSRGWPLGVAVLVATLVFTALGCLAAQTLLVWGSIAASEHFWQQYLAYAARRVVALLRVRFGRVRIRIDAGSAAPHGGEAAREGSR